MKLFIVGLAGKEHSKLPQCALDSARCAKQFSGCDVVALTDMAVEPGWKDARPYSSRWNEFKEGYEAWNRGSKQQRTAPNTGRYFIIEDYCAAHGISEPICQIDWDVLLFVEMEKLFRDRQYNRYDLVSGTIRENRVVCAPFFFNSLRPIQCHTRLWDTLTRYQAPIQCVWHVFCDIIAWHFTKQLARFTDPLNLYDEDASGFFDGNMSCDRDKYVSDERGKKLTFIDGLPYFSRLTDGVKVKALAVHTFIGWRWNTPELMAKVDAKHSD